MIEIEEDNVEAKTTTAQLSKTYCEGYFAFAKGQCTGNIWMSIAAYPNTTQLGTYEQFKEEARKQVVRWSSGFKEGEQTVSIKFSKVVLSE